MDELLAPEHKEELEHGSGIAAEVIAERGYRTAWGKNAPELLKAGFKESQRQSAGWIAPVRSPLGVTETVFKPDTPRGNSNGKAVKYEYPQGHAPVLDVHPRTMTVIGDPALRLWIGEGVKKGDSLVSRGEHCLNLAGVWNWRGTNDLGGLTALPDWEAVALNGRNVFIVFDSDAATNPGVSKARDRLARFLAAKGAHVHIVHLPPGQGGAKQGVDDFFVRGGTVEALISLAEVWEREEKPTTTGRQSKASVLLSLVGNVDLWHEPNGTAYATVTVAGHLENWPLRSRVFRSWLSHCFYKETGGAIGSQDIQDALNVLDAQARFEGEEHDVFVRCAGVDGRIYVDLGDRDWRAVEIDAAGWRVVAAPPVRFRRAKAMLALPEPTPGGSLADLRRFVNVAEEDWPLALAWVVAAFRPHGPYTVLVFLGEHGSAKSSSQRVLRQLVDPNSALLRGEPREARDLSIAANNSWVAAFDNVSRLPEWLSDSLCRLATGGGFATRELYSDSDEAIFSGQRPIMLNGIEEVVTRSDLLDRSIIVFAPTLDRDAYIPEDELSLELKKVLPGILGAVFDALSCALRNLDKVRARKLRLPRMADFAVWSVAAEPAMGLEPGTFLSTFQRMRATTNESVVEYSAIGPWVCSLADTGFAGTASDLLELMPEELQKNKSVPHSPRGLAGALRRLAPNLRALGIEFKDAREGHKRIRMLRLERVGGSASASSAPSAPDSEAAAIADAKRVPADASWAAADANFLEQGVERVQADGADDADDEMPAPAWEMTIV